MAIGLDLSCGYSFQSSQKVFVMKVAFLFEFTEVGIQLQCKGHVIQVVHCTTYLTVKSKALHTSIEGLVTSNHKKIISFSSKCEVFF